MRDDLGYIAEVRLADPQLCLDGEQPKTAASCPGLSRTSPAAGVPEESAAGCSGSLPGLGPAARVGDCI